MGPFALTVGLRLSEVTSSCRYAFGSAQSQAVMTTSRSRPWGRGGASAGYSPLAIRSVQSAKSSKDRGPIWLLSVAYMPPPAWPDWTRRRHASTDDVPLNMSGTWRVALLPIWWHPSQLPIRSRPIHSAWLRTVSTMPFTLAPLPGNSLRSGTRSREYQ